MISWQMEDLRSVEVSAWHLSEAWNWMKQFETIHTQGVRMWFFFFFSYSKNFWIRSALGAKHRLRTISHKYRKNRWQHLGIITVSQNCSSLPNAAGSLGKTISHFPKTEVMINEDTFIKRELRIQISLKSPQRMGSLCAECFFLTQ